MSCKLRICRKATLYSRRDPRRINDMVYIHPLMSSNPSCTLRGPAVVYSFPAAACTTAAMRRHCKSTLKKLLGEDSFQNIAQKASVITLERFSIKNCSDYIKMTKIRTDKRSLHKPRASVILSPLRPASLTHKNPQRRKIVHGMRPLGLKDRSIDLNMRRVEGGRVVLIL